MNLLLVEDERKLSTLLKQLLEDERYAVDIALDGERAQELAETARYDAIILDLMIPKKDGLEVCRWLRQNRIQTPVIMLTARNQIHDRVAGLDAGAEDYLAKPFDVDELLARLRALRRRHLDTARRLPLTGGSLDLDTRQVAVDGHEPVRLSARECTLLATLAARPARVFSRDDLRMLVFDDAGIEVVETYVHYLRRKLGRGVIDTVRGRGYQLGSLR